MRAINHEGLRALLATLSQQNPESAANIPSGRYIGQKVSLASVQGRSGKPVPRVTLRIVGGPLDGKTLSGIVHGQALRILNHSHANHDLFEFEVYIHRTDEGREYSRINVETLRQANAAVSLERAAEGTVDSAADAAGSPADYDLGFFCQDSVATTRSLVGWRSAFAALCECSDVDVKGKESFLSTYTFGPEFREYVASSKNGKKVGSTAFYSGITYSPLLPFDIDREAEDGGPDIARARRDAVLLCEALLRQGIPPTDLLVFFSGRRGFHVLVPASRFDAHPSKGFAAIAGRVCKTIADDVGVILDHHMYWRLQPMRSPNSRHAESGRFKVRLTVEELTTLPISEMIAIAEQPRPFVAPTLECEPIAELVALWREGDRDNQTAAAARSQPVLVAKGFSGITKETWDFLISGAREGERADRTFKAAANLCDFTSVEELITALMARPTALCGLPPAEADGHIASAIRRATECRVVPRNAE